MHNGFLHFGAALLAFLMITGCQKPNPADRPKSPAQQSPAGDTLAAAISGTVIETMNTAGYTYVQVDTGSNKIWAAAPQTEVKAGDKVSIPRGMPMKDYHSKTLDRTFDVVYFVSTIMREGQKQGPSISSEQPSGQGRTKPPASAALETDFSGITKPAGGKTVAEVYAQKTALAGKQVTVRGKVVKYSPGIMKRNWIHLQDGTGAAGTNDLTVTSNDAAAVGDIVVASGIVAVDKDFGSGYKYTVIIESARITAE